MQAEVLVPCFIIYYLLLNMFRMLVQLIKLKILAQFFILQILILSVLLLQTPGQYHRCDYCNGKQHVLISVTSLTTIICIYCYEKIVCN